LLLRHAFLAIKYGAEALPAAGGAMVFVSSVSGIRSAERQAARQRSPITVMIQLGEQAGQLCGAYLPAMVPMVPEFDDSETRLQWKFQNDRAQGTMDDELYIAFG
jgi:hypothetical protein